MSTSQARTPVPDLFARKGAARPAGQLIPYEKPGGNGSLPGPRDPKTPRPPDQAVKEGAGSLLAIQFRRQPPASDASPGAEPRDTDRPGHAPTPEGHRDATAPAVQAAAEMQPPTPPATSRPRPEHSHHGLVIAILTVAGLIAGVWYALDRSGLDLDTGLVAIRGAESETSAPKPEAESEIADQTPAQAEAPAPDRTPDPQNAAVRGAIPEPVTPSFDLIRIEPNGEAILAGRAAPNTELIVLDNGQPIGTVTADSVGEWALVPDSPVEPGQHDFALVVSTPQGTVTIPAPDAEAPATAPMPSAPDSSGGAVEQERSDRTSEPEPQAGSTARLSPAPAVDVPARKPELVLDPTTGAAPSFGAVYTVQLSSTPTLSGARRELRKLKQAHPELLGDAALYVQKARITGDDTRYRVRMGVYSDAAPARALCAAIRSAKQDCLVIQR